jgi:hypothetical protein
MIKQLRKRHLQVWVVLLLLIPTGIILAWISIPKQLTNPLLQPHASEALPVNLKSAVKTNYTVNIRTNYERSTFQLEWINKATLTNPSALIYQLSDPPEKNISGNSLIGRIDVKGKFYFNLKNDPTLTKRFVLYDIIHHEPIDTINF